MTEVTWCLEPHFGGNLLGWGQSWPGSTRRSSWPPVNKVQGAGTTPCGDQQPRSSPWLSLLRHVAPPRYLHRPARATSSPEPERFFPQVSVAFPLLFQVSAQMSLQWGLPWPYCLNLLSQKHYLFFSIALTWFKTMCYSLVFVHKYSISVH